MLNQFHSKRISHFDPLNLSISMKNLYISLVLLFSTVLFSNAQNNSIAGFTETSASAQHATEKKFDAILSAQNIGRYIKDLSALPHPVASPGNDSVVAYLTNKFRSWGFDIKIDTYYVLFPTPVTRLLEMTGSKNFTASLKELPVAEDSTTMQPGQLPAYNCWSADGDVTAELVFVNFGVPADYDILARMGVDVKGKIVIAKYGQSWRGIKPKLAQEHGAIGCILYSDPRQDGYFQGDVYPKGPFKPGSGVQRGSVMDIPVYTGDPLTPNIGATKDARRINRKDAINLLKIPVIPISYGDALPLLESLEGQVVPESWRGALPITYHVGPSKNKVHLKLSFDWQIRSIHDVIATLKGSEFPDEWVIRGNHHDAWVNGASDPVSGLAALMEEARAVGEMSKSGFKPKRSIVYCAWDGEEQGLLGSTEWVEDHYAELQQKAVLYINSDDNGRGFLLAAGSHSLEPAFAEIVKEVKDPRLNVSVFDRKRSKAIIDAATIGAKKKLLADNDFKLDALGSGSDYSPFIHHTGIPSVNISFGGENVGGEYHSVYDSYDLYKRFKDPTFEYGVALAKTAGRTTLRFAGADILPFNFKNLQKAAADYLNELIALTDDMRENTLMENHLIKEQYYAAASNITAPLSPPALKAEVPLLNFSSLQNAITILEKVSANLNELIVAGRIPEEKKDGLNKDLYRAEQSLLTNTGLPRRGWYKHALYAPGYYTGYGVKTMPGIREAIEQRNWKEAREQIEVTAAALNNLTIRLQATIGDLNL